LGKKSHVQLSGDVLLLTEFGVISTIGVIQGQYVLGASDSRASISSKISRTIHNAVRSRDGVPGWEIINSPVYQHIIIVLPTFIRAGFSDLPPQQLVMNSVTGAWTKYDLPAETMYEFGQNLYFTDDDGRVLKYGTVNWDNALEDGTAGVAIIASFQQAYSNFEASTSSKHFKMLKPLFESDYLPGITAVVSTDYAPISLADIDAAPTSSVVTSFWDQAIWDEALWAPGRTSKDLIIGTYGIGYSASLILKTTSLVETRYSATHWVFEEGISM
jgi:hypothetical protein